MLGGATVLLSDRADFGAFDRNDSADPEAGGLSVEASGLMPALLVTSNATPSPSPDPDTVLPVAIEANSTGGGLGVQAFGEVGVDGGSVSGFGVTWFLGDRHRRSLRDPERLGLGVVGRVAFGTVGAGTVPAGQNAVTVDDERVAETSHISVSLLSDPGPRQLQWVERRPGQGFRVHLSGAPSRSRPATDFTNFVAEHQE